MTKRDVESNSKEGDSSLQKIPLSAENDSRKPLSRMSRNWQGKWRKTPGRLAGVGLIRLYQLTLSGFVGNACRHQPTCSEYGYEAIARFGLMKGSLLAIKRIAKCGPFGTSGFDPVPTREIHYEKSSSRNR